MSFLLEDGTGLSNSNSYGTVAGFRAYHQDRGAAGVDESTPTDEIVQHLLIKATQYIDRRFGTRMKGLPLTSSQALGFPRQYAYDKLGVMLSSVPTALVNATYEYALRSNADTLWPDPAHSTFGKVIEEIVGPIEVKYSDKTESKVRDYPEVDNLLEGLLRPSGLVRGL